MSSSANRSMVRPFARLPRRQLERHVGSGALNRPAASAVPCASRASGSPRMNYSALSQRTPRRATALDLDHRRGHLDHAGVEVEQRPGRQVVGRALAVHQLAADEVARAAGRSFGRVGWPIRREGRTRPPSRWPPCAAAAGRRLDRASSGSTISAGFPDAAASARHRLEHRASRCPGAGGRRPGRLPGRRGGSRRRESRAPCDVGVLDLLAAVEPGVADAVDVGRAPAVARACRLSAYAGER